MSSLSNKIVSSLKTIIKSEEFTPLHAPIFEGNEIKYVTDCIESNFVSSVGEYVNRFEKDLATFTGVKHAIVAVNGTAALHISLLLSDVKRDDEVLIPAMTFIATANAVSYIGATPHFIDVEERTLGVDSDKLEDYLNSITEIRDGVCYNKNSNRVIKAIVPMHTFGHPVDMDKLNIVANKFNITVIEDAAESLGSFYKGKHTGNQSKIAALSFNGNKIITTGGGGAILTNDDKLAKKAKIITTTAKIPHRWNYNHSMIAYNYRMPALNAALGVAQLEKLPEFIKIKRELALKYKELFKDFTELKFYEEPSYAKSNYWLNVIILDKDFKNERDNILDATNSNGLMTRPVWALLNKQSMFKDMPSMNLDISNSLEKRVINIPSGAWL